MEANVLVEALPLLDFDNGSSSEYASKLIINSFIQV